MFRSTEHPKTVRPSGPSKKRTLILNYTFISFVTVGIVSIFLTFFHHRTHWLDKSHAFLLEKSAPLTISIEKLSRALHSLYNDINTVFAISEINEERQNYKNQAAYWQSKAHNLENENAQLRKIAKFISTYPQIKVSTDLITYPHLPFSHRFMIAAGENAGIERNAPVISMKGLIGRVTKVNSRSAEVLLLTDASSRIPVYIEATNEHAILAGSHAGEAQIVLRQKDLIIPDGSRIVTSGKGGMFSPGLFVGYTNKQSSDTVILAHNDLNDVGKVFVLETHDAND